MTKKEQLSLWVNGRAVHDNEHDTCCPDFSCCRGDMVDRHAREEFRNAYFGHDIAKCLRMLSQFLARAFPDSQVGLVTNEDDGTHEIVLEGVDGSAIPVDAWGEE